jgi:hypothetical protein
MSLIPCKDCGHQVSPTATACPNCGAPQRPACPHCGSRSVQEVDGLKGGENVIALVLLALVIIPGLAYYFDRTRLPYCTSCRRRVPKR